jgi:uncharacterized membrane protein YphA (DoxX/SURF4 family)
MDPTEHGLETAYWTLRVGLGVGAFLAGLDKYFDLLANWSMYLSSWVERLLPFSTDTFFHLVGAVEMAAGLLVLSRWTRIGAAVVGIWLLAIAVQLVTSGMFYDLAVRDTEMALGAFALFKLAAWHDARLVT